MPVTADQAATPLTRSAAGGKGRNPAGLDFGDVFACALAETTGEPLLFQGNDLLHTDIASAA